MSEAFLKVVNMSISASWLVLAVLVLRLILKKASKWVNVLLWGIVAVRLICPFPIESALSLIPSKETISPEIMMDWTPEISTGIEPLDQMVNPVISTSFAPEPSASANPLQILIPVAANLWVLGALVMMLYTAVSYISLRLKLRTAVILRDNIFQCETVHSPFVLGILKPRIYLPYTVDGVNLHHVVAHEQAHIRRKDHWWKPLGFLLLTVYWFNPLLWVAYCLLCRDIELACDEKVIAELGNEQRADYTQALVACSVNRRRIAACPLAFGEVGVKERVKSIMNYRKPAFWIIVAAVVVCVAVAVCFLTDPIDPVEDSLETDGMIMHQVSYPYATEEGYYLLIGADGVQEIQVSLPDSSGGVVNADGSSFKKGEKVYLEHLQNVTDLRGLSITALGKNGEVLYCLSIPESASMEEAINTVGSDGWLLVPTEHIIGYNFHAVTTDEVPSDEEIYEKYISNGSKGKYHYVDLDEDGKQELFISRNNGESEIVTISEGKAVTVMAANHLFLCDGGIIGRYSEGGGGCTVFYYKMDDNEAVTLVDVIMTTFHDDAWYRSTDPNLEYASPENMTRITKEDAYKIIEQYVLSEDSVPWYLTFFYPE